MGDISWVLRRKIRRRLSLMSLRSEEECEGGEEDPGQDDQEEAGELEQEDTPETVICWATATSDHIPSPYDREGLSFRAGQKIKVLSQWETGDWWGECEGRRGRFKFNFVSVTHTRDTRDPLHTRDEVVTTLELTSVSRLLTGDDDDNDDDGDDDDGDDDDGDDDEVDVDVDHMGALIVPNASLLAVA